MIDDRELFDRAIQRFVPPERSFDRLVRRRELKRRNRRIAATVVALGLFAAIIAYFGASIGLRTSQPVNPAPTPFRHNGEIAVFQDVVKDHVDDSRVVSIDPGSGRSVVLPIAGVKTYPSSRTPEPSWSPDGSAVAYVFAHHLWILDVSTGQSRDVASCGSCFGSPTWSPDGSTIGVNDGAAIALFDVRTSDETMLHPLGDTGGITSLAWSPDGQRIAFIFAWPPGGAKLYTVRPDGFDLRLVARHAQLSVTWSPDGSTIAYLVWPGRDSACSPDPCSIRVKVVDPDGSDLRTLYSTRRVHFFNWQPGFAWSPDGTQLALAVPSAHVTGLFVMSSDGTGLRLLIHGAYGRPSWRPIP